MFWTEWLTVLFTAESTRGLEDAESDEDVKMEDEEKMASSDEERVGTDEEEDDRMSVDESDRASRRDEKWRGSKCRFGWR